MTHETKMSRARTLLEQHNAVVPEGDRLSWEKFEKHLQKIGATTDQALTSITWEDIQEGGVPRVLSRSMAEIFRETPEDGAEYISAKKAEKMNYEGLFAAYDANNPGPVWERLKRLAGEAPVIVFGRDRKVDVKGSTKLLEEHRKGFPARKIYVHETDGPLPVYKVGECPAELADENPLYPGRALRPDGTCDQTNRSWAGVSQVTRQLLRVAVDIKEIKIETLDWAHHWLDRAMQGGAHAALVTRLPGAAMRLRELTDAGTAPTLKVSLSRKTGQNNPFPSSTN